MTIVATPWPRSMYAFGLGLDRIRENSSLGSRTLSPTTEIVTVLAFTPAGKTRVPAAIWKSDGALALPVAAA